MPAEKYFLKQFLKVEWLGLILELLVMLLPSQNVKVSFLEIKFSNLGAYVNNISKKKYGF